MKKKLLYLLVAWFLPMWICAGPVDPSRALQAAHEFVQKSPAARKAPQKGTSTQPANIVYTHKMPQSGRAAFYIINVDDAFVIVSADDVAYQVLGYSFDKSFPIAADGKVYLPPHVKGFFDDLARQIEAAADAEPNRTPSDDWTGTRNNAPRRSPSNLPESVDPLLTTTWDQGALYNTLCPEDDGGPNGHVWAGCVATAMAQIINYWSSTPHGRGTHSYDSNYGTLEVNFENSFYDFANMPDALTNESTQEQINAVAKLIFDCGVAVNMEYGAGESASFNQEARAGLINFFLFSPDMSFAEKEFFTDNDWNTLLCENLAANHPVIYSGQSGNGGHTFICDGYKADNYYHFNFGWGGFCDGWYLTSAVDVNNSSYNSSQSALVGIVPDNEGNVILGQMKGNSTFTVNEPLEFYNLMGHNVYEGNNYLNFCDNTVTFIPADATKQMVVNVMEFEDQTVNIYNGTDANDLLRTLTGGADNDLSPVVSTANALTMNYKGNMYYAGFKLSVSQESNCRMVSNIVSTVDNTTVHLEWTENGAATQWQIEYGVKGFKLGEGTVYNTNTNSATIDNLEKFTEYDFYIRSVYDSNQYGPWNKISVEVEAPYWQDVVTSQPDGYFYNEEKNRVEISTAEGLAWWSMNVGESDVCLTSDISLAEYKWRTPNVFGYFGHFSGNGHVISNIDAGLINDFTGVIEDVRITDSHIKSGGALGYDFRGQAYNCSVTNSVIESGDYAGGLIGRLQGGSVTNCYVNAYVMGARWASLLVGMSYGGKLSNCYAAGSFKQSADCYNGGIVAWAEASEIRNCYAVEMPMGVIGNVGAAAFVATDTATFIKTDMGFRLKTPAVFDGENVYDLLTALNKEVEQKNDTRLNTWRDDTENINDGYPVFGSKHVVQYPNVTDVVIQNVMVGGNINVSVGWTENGSATQWQIRYRRYDTPEVPYTYISTTNNPTSIQGILTGYVYDFSVRAIYDSDKMSGWSEAKQLLVDLPFWTDVVTSQPEGYVEDSDGNVEIYSAEGLSWLSSVVVAGYTFEGKTVTLMNDINLEGYRWRPIGDHWCSFSGTFDGGNYTISNTYTSNDELEDVGLFSMTISATLKNIRLLGGKIINRSSASLAGTGGLVGCALDTKIINCHSSLDITGITCCGSLCGKTTGFSTITNCSAKGNVEGDMCGGLIGFTRDYSTVSNCYSTEGVINAKGICGGLIGYKEGGNVYNCYSNNKINSVSRVKGKVIGAIGDGEIHYIYGQDNINSGLPMIGNIPDLTTDVFQFRHNGVINTLLTTVSIDGVTYDDLLEALNAYVKQQKDQTLRTWILDANTGFPAFGDYFEPSCYFPTDLMASQATVVGDNTIRTQLSWSQIGEPASWEVLYVTANQSINLGVIVPVTSNPCMLTDIPTGRPLDFYVRAVNSENDKSRWSDRITYTPDKLFWVDVVTEQPDGYIIDEVNQETHIYTAEGLAWYSYAGAIGTIYLESDIDMSQYKWSPIYDCYFVNFNGKGHVINGLNGDNGLFGSLWYGTISNIRLTNVNVYGESEIGAIAGMAQESNIYNCSAQGKVGSVSTAGGLAGCFRLSQLKNSSFVGTIEDCQDIPSTLDHGHSGGLVGIAEGSVLENNFFSGDISALTYNGLLTETSNGPQTIQYCYGRNESEALPFTSGDVSTNLSYFTGSDFNWTLTMPPCISGVFYTDLVDALNAWVDANNTEGKYHHWMADTNNVNGGFPIFAVMGDVTAQGYEGVYDGEAHAISVTAPEGATVRYGETADACVLDASPTYTDAGSYTVYYEVTKANYTPVTGSAAIVITKAAGTIGYATANVSKTYGDEPFTNELTLVGDGTVSYASSEPSVATVDAATGLVTITGNGTAIITATVDDGTNYTYAERTATYTLSVGTATMNVAAQGYEGVYDGEAHAISVTAPEGATVRYGEAADACTLDASPAYTDAGSYTVYYEVTKANYTPITGSQTVVITTKAIERIMIVEIAAQVYTGSELTPAATVIDGNIVLTEGIDYAIAYENNVKVGTATITVTGMGNYNGSVQVTFAIVADKTALAATIDAATAYYESICDRFANIAATLHDAIEDAMDIFNDTAATQEDTDAAVTMLNAAIKAAKEAVEQAQTVKAITIQQTDDVWYTVDGRRLNGRPHAKGIYICNDRLVVIK